VLAGQHAAGPGDHVLRSIALADAAVQAAVTTNRKTGTMRGGLGLRIMFVLAALVVPSARAAGIDLHWLWDDRCADCHGHAGDFARRFLSVSEGRLQGWHHVNDLRRFLHNHYLSANEVDAVYAMLLAQAASQARFRQECAHCHDSAAGLVRTSLELRDGILISRRSGRPVRGFLEHHRGLKSDDVDFFVKLLTRVSNEIYRP